MSDYASAAKATGLGICGVITLTLFVGSLLMITHPNYSPIGWLGLVGLAGLLIAMFSITVRRA